MKHGICLATLLLLMTAGAQTSPVGPVQRVTETPLITPSGSGIAAAGTFNPAAVKAGDRIILLYREQDRNGTSRIGYASSRDGLHFQIRPQPVLTPQAPYEQGGGVEDPRLIRIGSTWYLTYTGYNRKVAQLCLATSTDLIHWRRQGVILDNHSVTWNTGWAKSGAILPVKIHGRYFMYFVGDTSGRTHETGIARSADLRHWSPLGDHPVLPVRPGYFDSNVVEPGPPPILTSRGILLFYNGADEHFHFGLGWALFDRNDPSHLLARSSKPLLLPDLPWEKEGQVPNVVFTEGLIQGAHLAATRRRAEQSARPSPASEARPQRPTDRGPHELRSWGGGAASTSGAVAPHALTFYYGAADHAIGAAQSTLLW